MTDSAQTLMLDSSDLFFTTQTLRSNSCEGKHVITSDSCKHDLSSNERIQTTSVDVRERLRVLEDRLVTLFQLLRESTLKLSRTSRDTDGLWHLHDDWEPIEFDDPRYSTRRQCSNETVHSWPLCSLFPSYSYSLCLLTQRQSRWVRTELMKSSHNLNIFLMTEDEREDGKKKSYPLFFVLSRRRETTSKAGTSRRKVDLD